MVLEMEFRRMADIILVRPGLAVFLRAEGEVR